MTQESAGSVSSDRVQIRSVSDIPDAIAYGLEHGSLLLSEANLCPEFFDLSSGLAGETMHKFVNYRIQLAIIVAAPEDHGGVSVSSCTSIETIRPYGSSCLKQRPEDG